MSTRFIPLALAVPLLGCRQDMHDQPRFEPLEATVLFEDGRSARPGIAGTIARGELMLDEHLYTGRVEGEFATTYPFEITGEVLARGRLGFNVNCAPCHDETGGGLGMIVRRGMTQPPSYHIERLREAPPGYVFDVITNGFGAMYDYADRIAPADRWAIVAWVETLKLASNARLEDVPADERAALEAIRPAEEEAR
ncbi:MAG: cytochrome c [Planctomycetota bacterium]